MVAGERPSCKIGKKDSMRIPTAACSIRAGGAENSSFGLPQATTMMKDVMGRAMKDCLIEIL